MKTKLVKILALSAVALSLGACGKKPNSNQSGSSEEQFVTKEIDEVLALDADNKFELLGQKIRVENLVLQGNYGLTYVGGTSVGEYVKDLRGLEINAKEAPTFSKGSGWGSDITVEGTLIDVNGRAVLDQATIIVNSEREYNEDRTEYTGGLPVYMWPAIYMDRGAWDQQMGRKMSGLYFGGQFEVASVPEAITATKGSTFQVVFPGEYADTEDPDNNSLITVNIPAGIPEAVVTTINKFIEGLEVGDFVDIDTVTQYDLQAYGGMGILLERFGGQTIAESKEAPTIYKTWAEVAAIAQEYYANPLPNLTSTKPFTYKVDTSYVSNKLSELFTDTSWISLTDIENAVFVEFNMIAKPSEIYDTDAESDLFREVAADLVAAGYVKDTAHSQEGEEMYTLTIGERVVAEAVITAEDGYLDMYYMGDKLVLEFENFAGVKAVYEERAGRRLGEFSSALVDAPTAGNGYELVIKAEDAYKAKYGIDIYEYGIEISYETLAESLVDSYADALAAAGFEAKLFSAFDIVGLFNETSNEFVAGIEADLDENILALDVFALSDAMVEAYISEVPAEYDSLAEAIEAGETSVNAFLVSLGLEGNFASALPTTISAGSVFTLNDASVTAYASYYTQAGFVLGELTITVALGESDDIQAVYQAYAQALVTAGFAYGKTLNIWKQYKYTGGFWNATTGEYVLLKGDADGNFVIDLVFMNETLANDATYGIADDAPAA